MRRNAMMMITAAAALVLIHSVNSFALKENKGREKNKAPVLLGSGKGSWIVGVKRVKNIFAAAL